MNVMLLLLHYLGMTWVDLHREPAEQSIVHPYAGVIIINSVPLHHKGWMRASTLAS